MPTLASSASGGPETAACGQPTIPCPGTKAAHVYNDAYSHGTANQPNSPDDWREMQEQADITEETQQQSAELSESRTRDDGAGDSNESPAEPAESSTNETEPDPEDTFPRSVVEELRQENGRWRHRTQKSEKRLHTELVRATGRLADPTDLAFDDAHLDDPTQCPRLLTSCSRRSLTLPHVNRLVTSVRV